MKDFLLSSRFIAYSKVYEKNTSQLNVLNIELVFQDWVNASIVTQMSRSDPTLIILWILTSPGVLNEFTKRRSVANHDEYMRDITTLAVLCIAFISGKSKC